MEQRFLDSEVEYNVSHVLVIRVLVELENAPALDVWEQEFATQVCGIIVITKYASFNLFYVRLLTPESLTQALALRSFFCQGVEFKISAWYQGFDPRNPHNLHPSV